MSRKQKKILSWGKKIRAQSRREGISALVMICEYPVDGDKTGVQALSHGKGQGFILIKAITSRLMTMPDECGERWQMKVLRAIMELDGSRINEFITDEALTNILNWKDEL